MELVFTTMISFRKSVILFLFLTSALILNAQKIAHLNLDSLINNMTETKTAQQVIDKFRKEIETESINMQTEFENKLQEFREKENTLSASIKQSKVNSLQQLQKRVEDFKNAAYPEIQKKYTEMTTPIIAKAKKGIEDIAKEAGYKYVLDTSSGNVLYSESSENIYSLVLKKLEAMPPAELPVKNSANPPQKTTPKQGKK
ncbi:MAG: hypothetical protein JWO32_2963 [Bacteroidetes bacterium]|nr:hypothetical protein [Bacteroidota bacterium]